MGRSFDDVEVPPSKPKRQPATGTYDSTPASSGFNFFSIAESSSDAESHSSGNQPSPETDGWVFEENSTLGVETAQLGVNSTEEQDTAVVHVPRSTYPAGYTPTPWGLVDPLLKDLSQFSRYYIHHCETSRMHYLWLR